MKSAMEQFSKELKLYRDAPRDLEVHRELNQRAYRVARALRTSVEQAWSVQLGPVTDTKGQ